MRVPLLRAVTAKALISLAIFAGPAMAQSAYIDVPDDVQTFSGTGYFSGWAIDSQSPIASVTFTIDGVNDSSAQYGASRGDVCSSLGW